MLKFIDIENCQSLMPRLNNLIQILHQFDNWLETVDHGEEEKGLITKLVEQNCNSQNKKAWNRLYAYDADIGFEIDLRTQKIHYSVKPYYKYPNLARPREDWRIVAQFWQTYEDGTKWAYKMPVQCLLKNWGDANSGYKCYLHTITAKSTELSYAGITKRNWLQRLDEHLREMRSGSKKLFHKAWRDSLGSDSIIYGSELLDINASFETAMDWEEWFVDEYTLSPKGLNMIPGGLKGFRFLHEHKITNKTHLTLKERDRAIAEYVRRNPRKGIPNPFIAELWQDDEFYLRVINSRDKTLNPEQVRKIRSLNDLGWSEEKIVEEIDALNVEQVRNVLKGKTYRRIH